MILTKEQVTERRARLAEVNQTHACSCIAKLIMRLRGTTIETQCTEIVTCETHDPRDYIDTVEAAWRERDEAIKQWVPDYLPELNALLEKMKEKEATVEALKAARAKRDDQADVNTRWLLAQFDMLHDLFCPDRVGTWQMRVEQVIEAVKDLKVRDHGSKGLDQVYCSPAQSEAHDMITRLGEEIAVLTRERNNIHIERDELKQQLEDALEKIDAFELGYRGFP